MLWRIGGWEPSMALSTVNGGSRGAMRRGNVFLMSRDRHFILKQESHSCLKLLEGGVAARYARRAGNVPSLLPRLVGAYTVTRQGKVTHWLVTTNVFGARPRNAIRIRERYDIKGSTVGRQTRPKSSTLKDLDARDDSCILHPGSLQKANNVITTLKDDTTFIQNLGLLDYSLLIGICDTPTSPGPLFFIRHILFAPLRVMYTVCFMHGATRRGVHTLSTMSNYPSFLTVGLIDIFQPWTCAKHLEFLARGARHGYCSISAVPPLQYRARFLTFVGFLLHGPRHSSNNQKLQSSHIKLQKPNSI